MSLINKQIPLPKQKPTHYQQELAESRKILATELKKFEDIQLSIERKNLKSKKALVVLETQQQAQLAKANEQYNEQIQMLYAEIAELRKTNEVNREKY